MIYLALAIIAAVVWLLGASAYLTMSWIAIQIDWGTRGRRRYLLLDLLIVVAWPLLLGVEGVVSIMRRFSRARIDSQP